MSHFSVLLVIEDIVPNTPGGIQARVESEMAPFMENCCGEPDKIYMKFYDEEDEYRKEYEEEGREMVVMPDGRLLHTWDKEFSVTKTDGIFGPGSHKVPEHLPKRMVPYKESFSTFEEFVREWHGRKERDETYNRFGYWQNPNAKWDWYEIGGRWAGFFKMKPGRQGGLGSQYNFSGELEKSSDLADVCLKSAIDFKSMRKEARDNAAKVYDAVHEAIKGTPEPELWVSVLEKYPKEEIDTARKEYHDQPRVKAFSKFSGSKEGSEMLGFFSNVENFNMPREQYLANASNHVGVPFALIRHGKWYEQGRMGWWGMVADEKDPETWNSMVSKLMDELADTTLLVVIDCHI
jgi:hypothetical protein